MCRACGGPTKSPLGICNRSGRCLRAFQRENRRRCQRAVEKAEALQRRAADIWAPSWPQALAYFRREYPRLTERRRDLAALRLCAVLGSYRYEARGLARLAAWGLQYGVLSGKRPPARPTQASFLRAFRPRVARVTGRISGSTLRRWRRLYAAGGPDALVDFRGRPTGPGGAQLPRDVWRTVLRGVGAGQSLVKLLPKLRADLKARGWPCPGLRTLQAWTAPFRLLKLRPKQTSPGAGDPRIGSQGERSGAGRGAPKRRNRVVRGRSFGHPGQSRELAFTDRPGRGADSTPAPRHRTSADQAARS